MRRILLIGYSGLAIKRILPALNNHPYATIVGIATKTKNNQIPNNFPIYKSYKTAIDKVNCDTVYISLHNSAHFQWIFYSLKKGKHVICDKPAVLRKKEAQACCNIALDKLLIFEAFPYLYHKQHLTLKSHLKKHKASVNKITAHFGFPPLDKKNFRNYYVFGGGCIYDIGPYLISVGRFYFGKRPIKIYCSSYQEDKHEVPISAAATIHFGDNEIVQGFIGFNLEYRNHLELWGKTFHFSLDRAFSTPPDFKNTIYYKSRDQNRLINVNPCDSFSEMFREYTGIVNNGSYQRFNQAFLEQAVALEAMNRSAKTGKPINIIY